MKLIIPYKFFFKYQHHFLATRVDFRFFSFIKKFPRFQFILNLFCKNKLVIKTFLIFCVFKTFLRISAIFSSFSTAITLFEFFASSNVKNPRPGPISKTISSEFKSAALIMFCKILPSVKKFWPSPFFGKAPYFKSRVLMENGVIDAS